MIKAAALIAKFQEALDDHWGYIWGTAGGIWTQKEQDAATREMTVKFGQQWVGRHVADCSGLFTWAFKQLGGFMYHGSNTMYREYCVDKGRLISGKKGGSEALRPVPMYPHWSPALFRFRSPAAVPPFVQRVWSDNLFR